MTTTISHVRGCKPQTMIDYGRSLKASGKTFIGQVNGMKSAVDRTMMNWQGGAASTAAGRALSEQVSGTKIDECIDLLGDLQVMWGNHLTGIRDPLLDLVDRTIPGAGMKVSDDGTVTAPRVPLLGNPDGIQAALLQQSKLDEVASGYQKQTKDLLKQFKLNEDLAADAIYRPANFLHRVRKSPTAGWKWVANPGTEPGVAGGPRYVMGRPTTPHYDTDDDFKWNTKKPNAGDYQSFAKWRAYLLGGRVFKDLDDGTEMYRHFLSNKGTKKEFDYSEGYREDPTIKKAVDTEISDSAKAVDELVRSGHSNFSITGDTRTVPQVSTDNWRKTIGSYQQWSHSNVRVEGNRVYMDITVEAGDRYNFNRGAADVTSGKPDSENGRFIELGWAKPFDSHGSITKTVSWEVGHPPPPGTVADVGSPQRDLGGEDRSDNRYSKSPNFPR